MNDRIEKIKDSIDETDSEIKNIQFTIHSLEQTSETARIDDKIKIKALIKTFESEIDFLEDIKENDERVLEGL